jgi:hypothetical protein
VPSTYFVLGDPLHTATFPIPQFHFQIGDFAKAADLLFDMKESPFEPQISLKAVFLFLVGLVIENVKFAFDVNGRAYNLDIEFLRVNIVAHENALYDPQKSEFLEGHGTYTARSRQDEQLQCSPSGWLWQHRLFIYRHRHLRKRWLRSETQFGE